ncbi:hypothetical protein M513_12050 [Trichuris suis]|uniref:Peptidase aspartic putative domain-containing protein n=1 Tax=Trichuris suis TaxID=68888 RepID=A0A085LQ16_9BILA|nr:hypothetical protein M513_12050 [Trichuris suis]
MLHGAPRLFDKKRPSETARREQGKPFTGAVCNETKSQCLLPIVPLMLVAPDGRRYRTCALLDSGSEVSMIHMDVANALGLHGPKELSLYVLRPTASCKRPSCVFQNYVDRWPVFAKHRRRLCCSQVTIAGANYGHEHCHTALPIPPLCRYGY